MRKILLALSLSFLFSVSACADEAVVAGAAVAPPTIEEEAMPALVRQACAVLMGAPLLEDECVRDVFPGFAEFLMEQRVELLFPPCDDGLYMGTPEQVLMLANIIVANQALFEQDGGFDQGFIPKLTLGHVPASAFSECRDI